MIPLAIFAALAAIVAFRSMIVVPDEHLYVVERLGRYHRTLQAGIQFLVPFLDRVAFRYSALPRQEEVSTTVISHDNVPFAIASRFTWKIAGAQEAAYASASAEDFVRQLLPTLQREVVATRQSKDLRETTRELQQEILRAAAERARGAGVEITDVKIERIERATPPPPR